MLLREVERMLEHYEHERTHEILGELSRRLPTNGWVDSKPDPVELCYAAPRGWWQRGNSEVVLILSMGNGHLLNALRLIDREEKAPGIFVSRINNTARERWRAVENKRYELVKECLWRGLYADDIQGLGIPPKVITGTNVSLKIAGVDVSMHADSTMVALHDVESGNLLTTAAHLDTVSGADLDRIGMAMGLTRAGADDLAMRNAITREITSRRPIRSLHDEVEVDLTQNAALCRVSSDGTHCRCWRERGRRCCDCGALP